MRVERHANRRARAAVAHASQHDKPGADWLRTIGAGESISQRLVAFAHVHGLRMGVGTPVALYSSVKYESAVSKNGPNSWNRPKVDGAPGPPLYQIESGICFQLGASAQM